MSEDLTGLRDDVRELKTAVKDLTTAVQKMAVAVAEVRTNDAHRAVALDRFAAVPSQVTDLDARVKAMEGAGAGVDRWVGERGYLRSRAFGGLVAAVLILFGAVRWADIAPVALPAAPWSDAASGPMLPDLALDTASPAEAQDDTGGHGDGAAQGDTSRVVAR